jgi:hypothetical protein
MNAFGFIPGYETNVMLSGREPLLLALLAFLLTFALTRLYTRVARVRGWGSGSAGGIHLHHMVFGIVMVLVSGLLAVAFWPEGSPWRETIAIFFGAGAALTLDEFALWLYLRDVYWCEEGRSSIDATLMGVVLAALLLVGSSPFGIGGGGEEPAAIVFGMVAFNVLVAVITLLKGKLLLGMVSIFVPLVGIWGAVRLAKPRSLWAKWFYASRPGKLARAHARFEASDARLRRLHEWFDDLLGGAPSIGIPGVRMEVIAGRLMMTGLRPGRPEPRDQAREDG